MELTLTGVRAGTPLYTAPEVFMGEDPSLASDVYSYGVLFLQILTGRSPFPQVNFMDMLRAKANWAGPDWGPQRRTVPASIRTLVEACLETKPEDRPATAIEARRAFVKARDTYLVTTSEMVLEQLGLPPKKVKKQATRRVPAATNPDDLSRAERERKLLGGLLATSLILLAFLLMKLL
jgi:serine/threonine protein kinase